MVKADDPQQLRSRADTILELHEAGDLDEALDACDELLRVAEGFPIIDPVVRESVFTARFERALLLMELGDLEAAGHAHREAADTPADLDDPDQRHEIAMALLNGGVCHDAVGDHDGALEAYDELISRFGEAEDPVTHDQVIRARVNRAAALLALDRPADTLDAVGALIAELDPIDALEAEQLAMAVRLRAAAYRAMDRVDLAVAALIEVDRCTDEDPAARSQVAAAHRERAEALAELGRTAEALAVLDTVLDRVRDDPDPVVQGVVEELQRVRSDLTTTGG